MKRLIVTIFVVFVALLFVQLATQYRWFEPVTEEAIAAYPPAQIPQPPPGVPTEPLPLNLPLPTPEIAEQLAKAKAGYDAGAYSDAIAIWKPLAEAGDPYAQFRMGWIYEKGFGVDKSIKRALSWYKLAVAQDHPRAMHNLAYFLSNFRCNSEQNREPLVLYSRAALAGFAPSQNNLAVIASKGCPSDLTEEEAVYWKQRAALQGQVQAMITTVGNYILGRGVPENKAEAWKWRQVIRRECGCLDIFQSTLIFLVTSPLDRTVGNLRQQNFQLKTELGNHPMQEY